MEDDNMNNLGLKAVREVKSKSSESLPRTEGVIPPTTVQQLPPGPVEPTLKRKDIKAKMDSVSASVASKSTEKKPSSAIAKFRRASLVAFSFSSTGPTADTGKSIGSQSHSRRVSASTIFNKARRKSIKSLNEDVHEKQDDDGSDSHESIAASVYRLNADYSEYILPFEAPNVEADRKEMYIPLPHHHAPRPQPVAPNAAQSTELYNSNNAAATVQTTQYIHQQPQPVVIYPTVSMVCGDGLQRPVYHIGQNMNGLTIYGYPDENGVSHVLYHGAPSGYFSAAAYQHAMMQQQHQYQQMHQQQQQPVPQDGQNYDVYYVPTANADGSCSSAPHYVPSEISQEQFATDGGSNFGQSENEATINYGVETEQLFERESTLDLTSPRAPHESSHTPSFDASDADADSDIYDDDYTENGHKFYDRFGQFGDHVRSDDGQMAYAADQTDTIVSPQATGNDEEEVEQAVYDKSNQAGTDTQFEESQSDQEKVEQADRPDDLSLDRPVSDEHQVPVPLHQLQDIPNKAADSISSVVETPAQQSLPLEESTIDETYEDEQPKVVVPKIPKHRKEAEAKRLKKQKIQAALAERTRKEKEAKQAKLAADNAKRQAQMEAEEAERVRLDAELASETPNEKQQEDVFSSADADVSVEDGSGVADTLEDTLPSSEQVDETAKVIEEEDMQPPNDVDTPTIPNVGSEVDPSDSDRSPVVSDYPGSEELLKNLFDKLVGPAEKGVLDMQSVYKQFLVLDRNLPSAEGHNLSMLKLKLILFSNFHGIVFPEEVFTEELLQRVEDHLIKNSDRNTPVLNMFTVITVGMELVSKACRKHLEDVMLFEMQLEMMLPGVGQGLVKISKNKKQDGLILTKKHVQIVRQTVVDLQHMLKNIAHPLTAMFDGLDEYNRQVMMFLSLGYEDSIPKNHVDIVNEIHFMNQRWQASWALLKVYQTV